MTTNTRLHGLIRDGVIIATIQWHVPTEASIYALPGVDVSALAATGLDHLTDAPFIEELDGCYRIDDRRPSQNHSYMVWNGDAKPGTGTEPILAAGAVYHFVGDEPKQSEPLTAFADVWALMSDPNALIIRNVRGDLAHKHLDDDPEASAAFDVEGRVTAWDMGAIYRSQGASAR